MKKRMIFSILAACLLLTVFAPVAYAQTEETTEATQTTEAPVEVPAEAPTEEETSVEAPAVSSATSGTCGDGLTWSLEGSTLTISGSGAMDVGSPWAVHKDSIKSLVFTGGVTTVAEEAFRDYDKLTSIDFGSAMKEIDTRAFQDCDGLTSISLPASFRRFGQESFQGCSNLETVICAGGMPSFNGNCLWNGNHITIYYPVNNPWPQQYVEELETNFGGRLEVLAGSGSSPASSSKTEPVKETTAPTTQPVTEPTTEPTTVPTTEPETRPVETTAPATVETTAATTAAAETTEPVPEEDPVEKAGSNGWIGLVIVAVVLTVIAAGALIFRGISHKDGKYGD